MVKYLGVAFLDIMELFHSKKNVFDWAVGCPCLQISTNEMIALHKTITWVHSSSTGKHPNGKHTDFLQCKWTMEYYTAIKREKAHFWTRI